MGGEGGENNTSGELDDSLVGHVLAVALLLHIMNRKLQAHSSSQ